MKTENLTTTERVIDRVADAVAGWRFAALIIAVLVFFEILLVGLLAVPTSDSGFGAFARDFRTWCFNYDPATGTMDWFYVGVMLSQPLGLAAIVGVVWRRQLSGVWQRGVGELLLIAGIALLGVGLVGISFLFVGEPDVTMDGEYPFPAERIRTAIEPPQFELLDHTGEAVSLEELQGKVVVVTAVYATCGASCPIILTELRRVTEQFEEHHHELAVLGITLDPERDGPEELTRLADRHRVEAPLYRLLHGDPDEVNRVLDDFSVSRIPDEERGEIDHANLFIVIDRQGKIAYRIALGDRTEQWLSRALEHLLAEDSGEVFAAER